MSKRLSRAIAEGTVNVLNRSSGEASVHIVLRDGSTKLVRLNSGVMEELAPKHTTPQLLKRSSNLKTLIKQGTLVVR
jgi:hypothetical protein